MELGLNKSCECACDNSRDFIQHWSNIVSLPLKCTIGQKEAILLDTITRDKNIRG